MIDFDTRWNYDDPKATETVFASLLPNTHTSDDADAVAQLLTQIARAQGLQRKFDQAQATLDEAQRLIGESDGMSRARIRLLLERGRVLNSSGLRDAARPYFQEAFDLAASAGEDFFAVDAAHMLAIVAPAEQSLAWNERALALAEASHDERARRWLGSLYNNIGWTVHDRGRHADALSLFERALQWRIANHRSDRDDAEIRVAKWCVARALRSLNRVDDALSMQQELLGEHERAETHDGFVFEEMAECLYALNRADDAKHYAALAYDELQKDAWLADNEPQRLRRLKEIASS